MVPPILSKKHSTISRFWRSRKCCVLTRNHFKSFCNAPAKFTCLVWLLIRPPWAMHRHCACGHSYTRCQLRLIQFSFLFIFFYRGIPAFSEFINSFSFPAQTNPNSDTMLPFVLLHLFINEKTWIYFLSIWNLFLITN